MADNSLGAKVGVPVVLPYDPSAPGAGEIQPFAGLVTPAGWALCDGSAISRTTFSQLFTAVGTTWGVGDGSTTFNVPDLRDRTLIGVSGTKTLGSSGGSTSYVTDALSSSDYQRYGSNSPSTVGAAPGVDFSTQAHTHRISNVLPPYKALNFIIRLYNVTYLAYGAGLATSVKSGLVTPRRGQYALSFTTNLTGLSNTRAVGIYYQDQDGNHRLKFNINFNSPSGAAAVHNITLTGVVFKNITNFAQAISGFGYATSAYCRSYANPGGGALSFDYGVSTSIAGIGASGDVELDSKPTWA